MPLRYNARARTTPSAVPVLSRACLRVGRCCHVRDVNARDTSRALEAHSRCIRCARVKASLARESSFICEYIAAPPKRQQKAGNSPRPLHSSTRWSLSMRLSPASRICSARKWYHMCGKVSFYALAPRHLRYLPLRPSFYTVI